MHPMVVVEIESGQRLGYDTNNSFDGFFELGVASTWIPVGRLIQARASQHGGPPRPANRVDGFVA